MYVSAWNVGEIDQLNLPPCHYGFQLYTQEVTFNERLDYYLKSYPLSNNISDLSNSKLDALRVPKRKIV